MDIDVNLALARVEECWRASHLAESTVRLYMKRLKPMKRIARELGSICVDQALLDAYVEEAIARKGLRSSIVKSRLTVVRWVCRVLDLPPYPTDSAGKPIFAKKEVPGASVLRRQYAHHGIVPATLPPQHGHPREERAVQGAFPLLPRRPRP